MLLREQAILRAPRIWNSLSLSFQMIMECILYTKERSGEGEREQKRKRMKAAVLMATPSTKSLEGESGGHERQ